MISKIASFSVLVFLAAFLSACVGTDDNSVSEGLSVNFGESHSEVSTLPSKVYPPITLPASVPVSSNNGYDHANLEHHEIVDKNGRELSIYRAYVVLDNLELVECSSVVVDTKKVLGGLINSALAHAGHGSEPVGGRSLDAPNVIDIVTQDDFVLPLGSKAIAPGRYCAMRIGLTRIANVAYGKPAYTPASSDSPVSVPEVPDLSGMLFALRGDYCDAESGGVCVHRTAVDIDDIGSFQPYVREVPLDSPLEISKAIPEVFVVATIHYGEWLHNIDITQLSGNANEIDKLLENVMQSIHISNKGIGELPVN
jgi:hypothetical protein